MEIDGKGRLPHPALELGRQLRRLCDGINMSSMTKSISPFLHVHRNESCNTRECDETDIIMIRTRIQQPLTYMLLGKVYAY